MRQARRLPYNGCIMATRLWIVAQAHRLPRCSSTMSPSPSPAPSENLPTPEFRNLPGLFLSRRASASWSGSTQFATPPLPPRFPQRRFFGRQYCVRPGNPSRLRNKGSRVSHTKLFRSQCVIVAMAIKVGSE